MTCQADSWKDFWQNSSSNIRFAEFGRATVMRNLKGASRGIEYFGYIFEELNANRTAIRNMVYQEWDTNSTLSPPRTRPSGDATTGNEQEADPQLEILAFVQGEPVFPEVLLTRFPEATEEFAKIQELKKTFDEKFPHSTQRPPSDPRGARVGGVCDFSIDGGKQPLDISRVIDLLAVPAAEMTVTRHGSVVVVIVCCCHCLLFVVCCLLFVVCCLLFVVVCCLLFVVCCLLFVVCCLLFVVVVVVVVVVAVVVVVVFWRWLWFLFINVVVL